MSNSSNEGGGYEFPQPQNYRGVRKVVTIPILDGNEIPVPRAPVPKPFPPAIPVKPSISAVTAVLPMKPTVPAVQPVKRWFENKDAAATKIQAVFRGYCVRKFQPLKHLKVIKAVNGELDSLTNRFQETQQRKKLGSDPRERLRWTEGIMALLLQLDTLQDVSSEVRLIRKALSKELQMLLETIDASEETHMLSAHMKVMQGVIEEFDTLKNRFQDIEEMKKLYNDSHERLRWTEGLMAMVLRLDALQGVPSEMRLIKKEMTKMLMMFQERIDNLEDSHP